MKYVNTKAVKRIETYKVKGPSKETRKYLVPLSFGPSSTTLLYILDEQLRNQRERMNRTLYELTVAHVDLEFEDEAAASRNNELWKAVQERFPTHTYTKIGIEDAFDLDIDWSSLGLTLDTSLPRKEQLSALLRQITTATSRADIASTLLTRLLTHLASATSCTSILYGDSTTRLAEKTLTSTAKGRGFSLPWAVSDGPSPFGMNIYYPMRDLLKKEIIQFTTFIEPPITDIMLPEQPLQIINTTSKSTTIEQLMTQYFASVEESYPSIVANVVRTGSKLLVPEVEEDSQRCGLCNMPVKKGEEGIYGWGGDQSSVSKAREGGGPSRTEGVLCYGCERSING